MRVQEMTKALEMTEMPQMTRVRGMFSDGPPSPSTSADPAHRFCGVHSLLTDSRKLAWGQLLSLAGKGILTVQTGK